MSITIYLKLKDEGKLSKVLKDEKNKRVYFVHVDHAIRKNSSKEALLLKNILK